MKEVGLKPSTLKISEVVQPETVDLDLKGHLDKGSLIRYLISLLHKAGKIESEELFLQAVYEREGIGPTYMGNFIAIPHGKSDTVISAGVAFGRSAEGVLYETDLGGGIAKLIFLLAIPDGMAPEEYVRVLARLARLLVHEEFLEALYKAEEYEDVISAIRNGEALLEAN
jgi:mannitol/fructose-specific phosphotransferase system IIA component (Ntr-type)